MKYLIVLISFFGSIGLFAQYSFLKRYDSTYAEFDGVFHINITETIELFSFNKADELFKIQIDDSGDFLWQSQIQFDSTQIPGKVFNLENNKYVSFGQKRIDSTLKAVYILDFEQGEVVSEYSYGKKSETMFDNAFRGVYRLKNGKFLLSTTQSETGTPSSLGNLVLFGKEGELLWDKVYSVDISNYHIDRINGLAEQEDSYYFSLMTSWDSPTDWGEKEYENNLVKIDKAGNEIWRISMADLNTDLTLGDSLFYIHKVFSLPNGNVACFSKIETKFYDGKRNFLLEFSPQGELLRTKEVFLKSDIEPSHSYQFKDGSLMMIGQAGNEEGWFMELFAVKFTKDLSVDWYKEYGYKGSNDVVLGVHGINSNDGVTMVGGFLNYDIAKYEPFIVHTDCRGNTTWDYSSCNINESEEELLVFPNPSNGQFNFHLPEKDETQITLKVYDVLGREVYQKKFTTPAFSIDLSQFASATYHYVLTPSNGEGYHGTLVRY